MNNLKELRKNKNLTQKEMAMELQLPYRTYQRYESGESQIKPDKAEKLANYFGVSVAYLLGYSEIKGAKIALIDNKTGMPAQFDNKKIEIGRNYLKENYTKERFDNFISEIKEFEANIDVIDIDNKTHKASEYYDVQSLEYLTEIHLNNIYLAIAQGGELIANILMLYYGIDQKDREVVDKIMISLSQTSDNPYYITDKEEFLEYLNNKENSDSNKNQK